MPSSFARPFTKALDGETLPLHWRIRSVTSNFHDVVGRSSRSRWVPLCSNNEASTHQKMPDCQHA